MKLEHGKDYLIRIAKSKAYAILGWDNIDKAFDDGGYSLIDRSQCDTIIPLDVAIRAPELQAENERLKKEKSILIDALEMEGIHSIDGVFNHD